MPIRNLILAVTAISLLLAACATGPTTPLPTVDQVDLARYTGTWYEIALIPNRFQADCATDTQARYRQDGERIRVRNRCRRADGRVDEVNGIAKVVPDSGNAKLRVSFFRPFYGNYWILALSPTYDWVLVGEPHRKYGWILARTPTLPETTIQDILRHAKTVGYRPERFQRTPQLKAMD